MNHTDMLEHIHLKISEKKHFWESNSDKGNKPILILPSFP